MKKHDTHGSNEEEWVGFDLDGTLAKYDGWKGIDHIGEPVESVVLVAKLLHWLGKKIKILTARVAPRGGENDSDKARAYVEEWCQKNLGFTPEVTYVKDASMVALFDDRAVAVEPNTGKILGGWPDALPSPSDKARKAVLGMVKKLEKKAALSCHDRLLRVIMRRNPGFTRKDAEKYISDGSLDRELAKRAEITLGEGGIDDVRKVISTLGDEEKKFILARGRTEYRDVPGRLAGRTVAYDKDEPVGFSDIYGVDNNGRVLSSPSIVVAVSDKARGQRLAGKMTNDAIAKVMKRVAEARSEKGERADRIKRFVWRLHLGNEASARAAEHAGFSEQKFSKPHRFRQFVLSRKDIDSTKK